MDIYKIFKLKTGAINLNDAVAEAIVTYCLSQMSNNDLNFEKWKIGIAETEGGIQNAKFWNCTTHEATADTKKYFLTEKIMEDANSGAVVKGNFLYVKK